MKTATNMVWMDLEMTGLDPHKERIIEVALIVTDKNLNQLDEPIQYVIHQDDALLQAMDEWNTATHTRTGLIDRVKASHLREQEVEDALLEYVSAWIPPHKSPLCGNTIHQDRRFLRRYMPRLDSYFHYRNIDVSSVKELALRWKPSILQDWSKKGAHKAVDDVLESIEEMRYYRQHFFKP